MKGAVYAGYKGLAWFVFTVVLLQFFLAGIGIFGEDAFGEEAIAPHAIAGLLMGPISLLLLLLAAAAAFTGSLSGRRVGLTALLFVLFVVQFILGGPAQDISPFVAALHPVNALILLGVSYTLARGRRLSQMAEAGPETAAAQPSRVR